MWLEHSQNSPQQLTFRWILIFRYNQSTKSPPPLSISTVQL